MNTKIGLNEIRTLMLGSQILLGFQFRGIFNDLFNELPAVLQEAQVAALLLMTIVIALLLIPGNFHRLTENGEDTQRLDRLISRVAAWSLWPFALALALDFCITVGHSRGLPSGLLVGGAFGLAALAAWWGGSVIGRKRHGFKERAMARGQTREPTSVEKKIELMLVEARIILPGIQALFGFQFLAVITKSFDALGSTLQLVHLLSLGCTALAIIMLMTPPIYHRVVYAGETSEPFYRLCSRLITGATVPFALGLTGDLYVTVMKVLRNETLAGFLTAAAFLSFGTLWYLYPLLARRPRNSL